MSASVAAVYAPCGLVWFSEFCLHLHLFLLHHLDGRAAGLQKAKVVANEV